MELFNSMISHYPVVVLSPSKHCNMSALDWFAKTQCRLHSLKIWLPGDNPDLHVKNLQVEYFELQIRAYTTIEHVQALIENNKGYKVSSIKIDGNQNKEVMEKLSVCTENVKQLTVRSENCMNWLSVDVFSSWKLKQITVYGVAITSDLILLLVQACTELTSIKLESDNIDDSAVIAIAQHYLILETLLLKSNNITWTSLLALSERGLPLKELVMGSIPNIPNADIARRCSHALSCIRTIITDDDFHQNGQDASLLIPYMTGLTGVYLNCDRPICIPLIAQHCHKLTWVMLSSGYSTVSDILSLCRANNLLQELSYYVCGITDTALMEIVHVCPHLHSLYLPNETDITDTGILTLSEHCLQLQELSISKCHKVTEAAVLQLLQRCRKLTTLHVSRSSLSEETWIQLDKNTQKRVRRW